MSDVFVSYSRRDTVVVRRICEELSAQGRDVWVDWEDIAPAAEWLAEISGAIESAGAFLFVISPDSVASEICARELQVFLERRRKYML